MDPSLLLHSIVGVNLALHLWEMYLVHRQRTKHVSTERRPVEVSQIIEESDFGKARSYSIDKLSFKMIKMAIQTCMSITFIYLGYYPTLWSVSSSTAYPISAFMALNSAIGFVLDLPLGIYENFVLEEKHGFNKYTMSFFLVDSIKKLVLSTVLMIPLFSAAAWVIENGGDYFFVYLWGFLSLVIFVMMTIYPSLIAPLFDKYSPLPEGDLKKGIEELAAKLDYPLTKIYVVDGSKRSGHSNAYMYGFWKNKRIVLYDTLLNAEEKRKLQESLGEEEKKQEKEGEKEKDQDKGMGVQEVVAVMGHELGHWALSHTVWQLLIAELNIFLMLFAFSRFHNNQTLDAAFGFPSGAPSLISLLVIMQYVMGVFSEVSSLLSVFLTRKMEFEADDFAAKLGFAPLLASALIKLSKDNLSLPVNDPLFSLCKHTHPPVTERIEAMKKHM